jgi:hypothetical protein
MNNLRTYLTEAYSIDNKSILRILTQNKQINKADPDYSYYEKLANWVNESSRQQKLKNIDLNSIKLSDRRLITQNQLTNKHTTLGHTLLALKNLMDQKGNYNPSSDLSNLIQLTTLEILAGLSGLKKTPTETTENDKLELYEGMDWTAEKARRLANPNGKATSEILDQFYNDYYKIEYAGLKSSDTEDAIVTKLKSLDKILVQEFTKLGYNPEVNPLAQFLKILIKLKKENNVGIFDKLTLNTYGAIHNSFKDGKLKGNNLVNYNDKHLVFCEDLYNYKGLSMVKYIRLFADTLKKAETVKVEPEQDKWVLVAKIFIRQDLADAGEPTDISLQDKVTALLNKQDNVRFPTEKNAKLRSFAEIEELYISIFKETFAIEKPRENEAINAIISSAISKNAVLDMIYYIITLGAFKKVYSNDVIEKIQAELKKRNYEQASGLIDYCKRTYDPHSDTLSKEDLMSLIKKLFKKYDSNIKKAGK